jgi:ribose transport system substrate-binding protein
VGGVNIAVFTKNRSNPAYEAARLGADRAAGLLGARTKHYVPAVFDDPVQQGELVDAALATGPDGIVFTPTHPTRVNDALRRIAAAKVPLAGFVNPISVGPCVTYVGADDTRLGGAIAGRLFAALGGKGAVLLVAGPAESVTSLERVAAFREAAAANPGIRLAGMVHGDYRRDTAYERVREWLAVNGDTDGIAAANDVMALGALDALEAAGHSATVVGVNAIPEAIAAIRAGRLLASADFNAMRMCYLATECLIRHLRGERVPARIDLPVEVVDASNCRRWDLPYSERPIPTLAETLA